MSQSVSRGALLAMALVAVPVTSAMAQTAKAAKSPTGAVQEFMRAAADSNLNRMAELFGTNKGSVRRVGDLDKYPKQMFVLQAALHGVVARTLGETRTDKKNTVIVTTEIARGACKATLPVRTVKAKEGWLVLGFDWGTMWDGINRPCEGTGMGTGVGTGSSPDTGNSGG